ncbi:MAG: hypothetical protein RL513_352 [Pseudomonadota bacterium]
MSLIARCPACTTLFRVVPDQLKISDGWVRCGQCSEVFDANQTLQAAPAPAAEAPAADTLVADTPAQADAPPTPDPAPEPPPEPSPEPLSQPEPELEREPEPALETEASPALVEASHAPDPAEPVLEPGPLPGDAEPAPRAEGAAPDAALQPAPEPAPEPEPLQDLAFIRQARRRAFWARRGVRVTMGVCTGVLTLLLAGQVVFQHRDRLASQVPALQPALAAMCASLQCRLGPPRRIESITIESSAFTRVRADAFRLSLTLSNQADIALALPAMELTLTDLQDQPVLRRVLQPADLGPGTPSAIAARTEWSTTLTLAIAPGANPARIVGYRVLAFYP